MPGYVIGNFFVYSVINAFTPGPGNILALNTVTNYGWKKGAPLFFGIFSGYYVVQMICAVFVYGVSTLLPEVLGVMKYVGAAYILWLAVHIAVSRPDGDGGERSASFLKGFMLRDSDDRNGCYICVDRYRAGNPEGLPAALPPDQHHSCCHFIGMCIQHIEIKACGYGDAFQKFR